MASTVKPTPIALVVCDAVYHESTRKTALVGLFNQIHASKFPAVHRRLCIYCSVTDTRSGSEFKIDIVHSETDETVLEMQLAPPPELSPTMIVDMTFELTNVQFKEAARYYIRFWGNGHLLLQRPFDVKEAPK
jgi:hypothetical protein